MDDICPICLEKPNNPTNLGCSHVFCYLCIKQSYITGNKKCPMCRKDLDNDLYENAKGNDIHIDKGYYWMYSGRNKGWWLYDNDTTIIIENGYEDYKKDNNNDKITIDILGLEYIIDFNNMQQINKYKKWRRRYIKREDIEEDKDTIDIKGISGLMEEIKID